MNNETYEQQTSQYQGLVEKEALLQLINPQADIKSIQNDLLGLEVVHKKDGGELVTMTQRINKPVFTDEAVKELMRHIRSSLNFTVQVTRFERDQINEQMKSFLKATNAWLNTLGYDHYISDLVWDEILAIHEDKYEYIDDDGKKQKVSGWLRHGVNWAYNRPVTYDMLKRIPAKHEEIESDQTVVFGNIMSELKVIGLASLNKSVAIDGTQTMGQLLKAMSEIRTESTTMEQQKEKRGFSLNPFNRRDNGGEWQ